MKKSVLIPLIVVALVMALVISACGDSKAKEPAETPQVIIITATPKVEAPVITAPPVVVATEAPPAPPTEPPAVVVTEPPVAVTDAPASGDMYFRDEFDSNLDLYDRFILYDDKIYRDNEDLEEKAGVELSDGMISFNIQEYWLYYYFIYEPQVYEDVKISIEVENLGFPASMAALVCRYDEDLGWYEVKIDSQGQWAMYYFDKLLNKWNRLTNGGASEFNYGKDTNKYTLVCQDKDISFYVNDVFSQSIENKNLKKGKVGFSVQSPRTYTLINVPWFEVSEP